MEATFYYLLKINIIMTVLVAVFYIFFRRMKFLRINRFLLLTIAVLSFAIPFFPTVTYEAAASVQQVNWQHVLPVAEGFITPSSFITAQARSFSFIDCFMTAYVIISAMFFIRLFLHVIRTIRIIFNAKKIREYGLIICRSAGHGPFSFFNYIILPRDDNKPTDQQVILHERAHARQWHSVDALFSEVITVILWINPMASLYKKLVRANLEFLADDDVLKNGADPEAYQLSLLHHVMKPKAVAAVNAFRSSGIRKRIGMMNTEQPLRIKATRYILLMPAFFLIYILVNPPRAAAKILLPGVPGTGSVRMINKTNHAAKNDQAPSPAMDKKMIAAMREGREQQKAIADPVKETGYTVSIDARTDTVRISLVPAAQISEKKFDGIYIIGNSEYSDSEIRELAANGTYEIVLPVRPALAYYPPDHRLAIQHWGDRAAKGVISVQSPSSIIP